MKFTRAVIVPKHRLVSGRYMSLELTQRGEDLLCIYEDENDCEPVLTMVLK